LEAFVQKSLAALRVEFRWYPRSYLRERIEEECACYVWRLQTIEDLWDQWRGPTS
jgi:hypothetical protein